MSAWLDSWRTRVRAARAAADTRALGELYSEVVGYVGPERASHLWLEEMSGWDASAVTG